MTAEAIAEHMSFSRTTCYRYVRELANVGLLVSHNGVYSLAPVNPVAAIQLLRKYATKHSDITSARHAAFFPQAAA
ncbi:hypothetical protein ACFQI9_21485 [Paraburkholderia dipogonis]|uniref:hypothetical protein n=1 Tax=Paraburkholderia dipogonis TaxID=1211383 RepID=UPI003610CDDC